MYKLKDVYKTFPSGATEDYKILRAFEMGKQEGGAKVKELEAQIEKMKNGDNCKYGCMACGSYLCEFGLDNCNTIPFHCDKWELDV